MNNELADLRKKLDEIDGRLLQLLQERFSVTTQVGIYKSQHNLQPIDAAREAQQLERIRARATEMGLDPKLAEDLLRRIIDRVVEDHIAIAQAAKRPVV